jgi:hypothetical protein
MFRGCREYDLLILSSRAFTPRTLERKKVFRTPYRESNMPGSQSLFAGYARKATVRNKSDEEQPKRRRSCILHRPLPRQSPLFLKMGRVSGRHLVTEHRPALGACPHAEQARVITRHAMLLCFSVCKSNITRHLKSTATKTRQRAHNTNSRSGDREIEY